MAEPWPKWQIGVELVQLGRRWRRVLDDELAGYGLTDATWRPLFHLGRLGDGIRQTELADAMGIQGPSLVRLLDNLERDGLIARSEDQGDRRAKVLTMTEAGRQTFAKVLAVTERVADRLFQDAETADLAALQRLFGQLGSALQAPGLGHGR
ncbi:MAG TPA: MarR family transcriptional regulator [Aliidongia sp.]|uniref:MarR family winged helix-turn-helix transcriptional regulator n=1 Tax=Aliidongia sp. TaxID=1914230 RepID=UPI002DDCD396|nr:MarR family transcriptional regulator [Aliidongia sp.]HEV2675006.1 MarR family transcriptional regulator [Aliidongia sp.]